MKIIFLISALFLQSICLAQIGETLDQCKAHYGTPIVVGNTAMFNHGRWYLAITFVDKKAQLIKIAKTDIKEKTFANLSINDIDYILKENGCGRKWIIDANSSSNSWITEDQAIQAYLLNPQGMIIVAKKPINRKDITDSNLTNINKHKSDLINQEQAITRSPDNKSTGGAEYKPFATMFSLSARLKRGQTTMGASEKVFYGAKKNVSKTSMLEIELRNMGADEDTFTLDYYFLCKYIGVESYRIFDYGSQFYSLGKMEVIQDELESRPIEKQIYNWNDGDRWEFGEKAGGFIVILKDRNGKTLTARSKIAKLQNILRDPKRLESFLAQTNNIPPPEAKTNGFHLIISVTTNAPSE